MRRGGCAGRGRRGRRSALGWCASRRAPRRASPTSSWSRTYPFSVARNRDQLLRQDGGISDPRACASCTARAAAGSSSCRRGRRCRRVAGATCDRDARDRRPHGAPRAAERRCTSSSGSSPSAFGQRARTRQRAGRPAGLHAPRCRRRTATGPIRSRSRRTAAISCSSRSCRTPRGKAHISMIEMTPRRPRLAAGARARARLPPLVSVPARARRAALHDPGERRRTARSSSIAASTSRLRWRLERVLLEGVRLVDATLHRAADRWWMFANSRRRREPHVRRRAALFHAERLLGEWKPHPSNPVKSDVRCARPAGELF